MKKYVVLGVNENKKYLYYLPLVVWAWKKFGWTPIVFHTAIPYEYSKLIVENCEFMMAPIEPKPGFQSATMSQVARLYGACVVKEDSYLMTSDVDMLPLSPNIFHYEGHRVLTIGRDLTDYHYPICYVGADAYLWCLFMHITTQDYNQILTRDLRQQKNMWGLDQDILTERLLAYGKDNIHHVNRGTDKRTGYPIGRVDRSHWTLDHKQLLDAHLPHDVLTSEKSFHALMQLLHTVWPNEDWKWFLQYTKEFKKL